MVEINPSKLINSHKSEKIARYINRIEKENTSEELQWVDYNISQWAGRLGSAKVGLMERIMNAMDATSMMHCTEPYDSENMAEALENIDKEVDVIFDGAKKSTKNVGYVTTVADTGKGQEPSNFSRFLSTDGSGGNKSELPIAQGCRTLGSLASVSNSKYVLILSASYRNKEEWTWTIVRDNEGGYEYLKADEDFPHYKGEITGVGDVDERDYGTIVKMFDYDMSSPEKAAEGASFRRMLAHRLPEPPIPVRIIDNRWDNKYVYQGLESELCDYKEVLSGKESIHFEHDKYGLVESNIYVFDTKGSINDKQRKFISTNDDARFLTSLNGQTHHKESPTKVKNNASLGEISSRCLINSRLLDTLAVKSEAPFRLSRQGFRSDMDEERKEFVSRVYKEIRDSVDTSEFTSEGSLENVSKTDFSVDFPKSVYNLEKDDYEYFNLKVSPYLNEKEQDVSIHTMNDKISIDIVEQNRRQLKCMIHSDGLTAGSKDKTDALVRLDGEFAYNCEVTVKVEDSEEEDEESEDEESEDEDNKFSIGGDEIGGFPIPENKMSKKEVKESMRGELPEFARKGYEYVREISLDDIGYEDNDEFYGSVSQLSSDVVEKDIRNRIRNRFVASEETRAGYLAEDIATAFRAQDNNPENKESIIAGLKGCEPDLVSKRDGVLYAVQSKLGTNTMNSDMEGGFDHAMGIVDGKENHKMILGIAQGRRKEALRNLGSNIHNLEENLLCGKEFWYWLTGNVEVAENFYDILSSVEDDIDIEEDKTLEELIDKKSKELAEQVKEQD